MVRARPIDIEVPEGNPFAYDLLDRREPIEVLTHLISGIEGPCVLTVDAPWGTGKTTFLRMWAQYLRDSSFRVVDFNAWETDFAGEPFVALSTELTKGLAESPFTETVNATKAAAVEVLKRAIPGLIKAGTAGILDLSPLLEDEIGKGLSSLAEDQLARYESGRESIDRFKSTLESLADDVAAASEGRPLVVMIDELDRCRPSYAVELLEVAKHLFSVDGIIFVLSLDRAELAHSVRSIYGSEFGASGYLRRFFDIDYRLPDPDTEAFVEAALKAVDIDAFYARTKDDEARQLGRKLTELMQKFFGTLNVSLRGIGQAVHRFGLVLASLPDDRRLFGPTAGVLLVLQAWRPSLYRDFLDGRKFAGDVIDEVFAQPGMQEVRDQHVGRLFETVLLLGEDELRGNSGRLQEYQALIEREVEERSGDEAVAHARRIVSLAEQWGAQTYDGGVGMKFTVDRLELLSPELRDEGSTGSYADASTAGRAAHERASPAQPSHQNSARNSDKPHGC